MSGTNIIVFGDSLVAGQGATKGNDFVSDLSRKVNTRIINQGREGDTTETALKRVDAVLANDPKVVIILVGGNDLLQKVSLDKTITNLSMIIDLIKEKNSAVILLGFDTVLLNNYHSAYKNLADQKNIIYIPDVLGGIMGHQDLMSDSIHPNDKGYAIMADRVVPILKMF